MAYVPFGAALDAVREVARGAHGSLRTVPAARFADDLHEGTSEEELARRGTLASKPIRVRITGMDRNGASPTILGSVLLYDVAWEVVVSRTMAPIEQVDADTMADLEALAYEDADVLRQALCTPPNLRTNLAGTLTGICGDALVYAGSDARVVTVAATGKAQRYETIHRFTAVMKSLPAAA